MRNTRFHKVFASIASSLQASNDASGDAGHRSIFRAAGPEANSYSGIRLWRWTSRVIGHAILLTAEETRNDLRSSQYATVIPG